MKKNIKDLSADLRPDEKFIKLGPAALSDAELLAIILRSGSSDEHCVELSDRILCNDNNESSFLNIFDYSIDRLMNIKGIGKVKAVQIKAVLEISRRIAKSVKSRNLVFNRPDSIAEYFYEELRHLEYETVILLMLDSSGKLLKEQPVSRGSVNSCVVSPREIFQFALTYRAVNIILIHNHPSGEVTPSKNDVDVTVNVKEAGKIIGINLLDHIIIGDNKYLSFREANIVL